jgi:hypothetical protein
MATKLKFKVAGDLGANSVLIEDPEGEYVAPNTNKLAHRFYFDAESNTVKDKYAGKTDRQVQEIEHEAAIALATELGLPPPPPLPAA